MQRVILSFNLLLVALIFAGCGSSEEGAPDLHPVTGTVTKGGSPLGNVQIRFVPRGEGGRAATGITDDSGKYKLVTPNAGEGAVAGQYKIVLTPAAEEASGDMAAQYSGSGANPDAAKKSEESSVPKALQSLDTTTESAEVKAESNVVDISIE